MHVLVHYAYPSLFLFPINGVQPGANTAGGGGNLFWEGKGLFWPTVAAIFSSLLCSPFTLLVSPFPAFPGFWGNGKRIGNGE
ncbi:hypothetical protein SLA2020_145790 [Shorea laevis]